MVSVEITKEKHGHKIVLSLIAFVFCLLCVLFYIFFRLRLFANSPGLVFEDYVQYVERDPYIHLFERYLTKFGKKYDGEEYDRRFSIFKASLKEIEILNNNEGPPSTARYGITKFSDMTAEEFQSKMMMKETVSECQEKELSCENKKATYTNTNYGENDDVPDEFDWRDHHAVGPILDQQFCMSCWAYSVVGVMESMLVISKQASKFTQLSVQELTDCSTYTVKCVKGSAVQALNFLCWNNYAMVPEKDYPITNKEENCKYNKSPERGVYVKNFAVRCDMSSKDIMSLIANHGPVTSVVNTYTWRFYLDGVIQYNCDNDWNNMVHVVQIVGYNKKADVPYFIIRNSWGADFGDKGYVYVAMDNFVCGIGRQITYFDVYQNLTSRIYV